MNTQLRKRIKHILFVFLTQYHSIQNDYCLAQSCACTAFALLPSSPLSKEAMDQSFFAGFRSKSCPPALIRNLVETADTFVQKQIKSYRLFSGLLGRISSGGDLFVVDTAAEYTLFLTLYNRQMLVGTPEAEIAHLLEVYADGFYRKKDFRKCQEILKLVKELGINNRYWSALETRVKGK